MATLFTRIVRGEIPSYKCAENNEFYAFLDINPIKRGHTLVVPKREVDYFFDLDDDEIGRMQVFAKQVAQAIREAFPCRKVAQAVIGLEVDHAHIHLVPIDREDELRQHTTFTPEEFKATANAINTIFEKNKA
ncbi:MAG: HIT domain-containing protein [Prevotellaceae bacterium]|nr:HIT domain-containing protein [Prevotellaceae bacterium]